MESLKDGPNPLPSLDRSNGLPESENVFLLDSSDILQCNAHVESKQGFPSSADKYENESAEVTRGSTSDTEEEPLTIELQEGMKILEYFLKRVDRKFTEHFMDAVDDSFPETKDYYNQIQKPMWLNLMLEKFQKRKYQSIREFVDDFKQMIMNCMRFNGVNHRVSKKAAQLNTMFEQKLKLLRADIKQLVTVGQTGDNQDGSLGFGQRRRFANSFRQDTSIMQRQLLHEEEQRAKEARRQKKEDSRAMQQAARQDLLNWEETNITVESVRMVIKHSWELPQIGLFLHLCRNVLMLVDASYYELERCLAIPQHSLRLQKVMTSLLSTPSQRERLERKVTVMPYCIWSEKLAKKMAFWYKTLDDCHGNITQAASKLGLDEHFFEVLGLTNPLKDKMFHKVSFYKRIWIIKSLCDFLTDTQESVRSAFDCDDQVLQLEDQRGQVLGSDRQGNLYVHIPQFCGEDLRIYRQTKIIAPQVRVEEVEEEEEVIEPKPTKGRAAKRKLNLASSRKKQSRSSTPLNDCETASTASSTPSERGRSLMGSSRQSSPMSRDTGSTSRQTSARNSPAPDDGFAQKSKGRKTRNSAESTFYDLDLESVLRQKSRRGRPVKASKAAVVSDKRDEESSQDGQTAGSVNGSSGGGVEDEAGHRSAKGESEKGDSACGGEACSCGIKREAGAGPGPQCQCLNGKDASGRVHIKTDKLHGRGGNSIASETAFIPPDPDGEICGVKKEAQHNTDNGVEVKPCTCTDNQSQCPAHSSTALPISGINSDIRHSLSVPQTCDTSYLSAMKPKSIKQEATPYINTKSEHPDSNKLSSVKKEAFCDDSGFVSFHTSPPKSEDGETPDKDKDAKTEMGMENANSIKENGVVKSEGSDIALKDSEGDSACAKSIKAEKEADPSDNSTTGSSVKEENGDCVEGEGASSLSSRENGRPAVHNALLDHYAYSEEEVMPDVDEFELVVSNMDDLDELIKKFDDIGQTPQEPIVTQSGRKSAKANATQKLPKRSSCEDALLERLKSMKAELDKHRARLTNFSDKARAKLRQEFEKYEEEMPKEDSKEWESDSENNTEDSDAVESSQEEGDAEESQAVAKPCPPSSASSKRKTLPKVPSVCSMDSSEADPPSIEDYEMDVSSRGRLRKRRIIPNNIEDQGTKKRKVVKKVEEEVPPAATTDNRQSQSLVDNQESHLQKQLGATGSVVIRPSGLQPTVNKPSGSLIAAPAIPRAASTMSFSHPVIQKILSSHNPSGLHLRAAGEVGGQPGNGGSVPTAAGGSGKLSLVMKAQLPSGKQQLVHITPEQQELLQSGVLRLQRSNQTLQLSSSVPSNQATPGQIRLVGATMRPTILSSSKPSGASPMMHRISQDPKPQGVAGSAGMSEVSPEAPRMQGIVGVVPAGTGGVSQVKMQKVVGMPSSGQGGPPTCQQGRAVAAGTSQVVFNTASGNRTLVVLGSPANKNVSRYAGNVTVKTLLENRHKPEESTSSGPADIRQALSILPQGTVVVTSSNMDTNIPVATTQDMVAGATARVGGQPSLDAALQTVVTSYHTTLPTADIKVPFPTTLPSLSPRKNVTHLVQSTKAPITTTPRLQTVKKSVALARAPVAAQSGRIGTVATVVPGLNVARPGTVMLPAAVAQGHGLMGGDSASGGGAKKPLVLQMIPQGGAGNVLQGYIVPQNAVQALQLADVKSAQPAATPLQVIGNQMPAVSLSATAGGSQLPGGSPKQGLLMTVPVSSSCAAHGSYPEAETSRVTSEVLKSMLAGKAVGLGSGASTIPKFAPALNTITGEAGNTGQNRTIVIDPVRNKITAQLPGQAPLLIPAQRAPAANTTPTKCGQEESGSGLSMAIPSPSFPHLVPSSLPARMQVVDTPGGLRMSVPSTVVGVQQGLSTVQLIAAGQSVSEGNVHPVIATIKPAAAQGLQQLQLLASANDLRHVRMQLATPQQQQVQAGGMGGVAAPGDKPTMQLCFKVQSGGQVAPVQPPTSIAPQPQLQVAAASPRLQGEVGGLATPLTMPGATAKVIMASQLASVPASVALQLQTQAAAGVSGPSAVVGTGPGVGSEGNHLSMSVTPGPLNRQFTISPVSSQLSANPLRPLAGGLIRVVSPQTNLVASGDGQIGQINMVSPALSSASVSQVQVAAAVKRKLSSGSVQPIPPKMACLDSAGLGGGNSGAVLASLSQMVGSSLGRKGSDGGTPTPAVIRTLPSGAGNTGQRVVKASSSPGDSGASSTLQNLAAHMNVVQGGAVAAAVVSSPANASMHLSSLQGGQVNIAPILQQMASANEVAVPGQLLPKQQQQPLIAVRRVGGQLLTPANVPVTVSNGEVKVLPKGTVQMGNQTVTVLSPSSAMIQNVRVPLNPSNALTIPNSTAIEHPLAEGTSSAPADSDELVSTLQKMPNRDSQAAATVVLKPDVMSGLSASGLISKPLNGMSNSAVPSQQEGVANSHLANDNAVVEEDGGDEVDNPNEKAEAVRNLLTFANQSPD